MNHRTIAIEGPAGAGKGTVAFLLAKKLGYLYIDTGSLYRGLAYFAVNQQIDIHNKDEFCKAIQNIDLQYKNNLENPSQRVVLIVNGEDISGKIRTQQISAASSIIGGYPCAVEKIHSIINSLVQKTNVIAEGQTIAEHLISFPDKLIYLTASPEIRARRRYEELKEKDPSITYEHVYESLLQRDHHDETREFNQMKVHKDAIIVDSSGLTIEQVVEKLSGIIG